MRFFITDDPKKKTADVKLIADDSKDRALLRLLFDRKVAVSLSTDNTALYIEFTGRSISVA